MPTRRTFCVSPLHTAVSETFDSKLYTMAAEVGVLTRNIKIIGEYHPNLYSESYGARVVVGSQTEVDKTTMQLLLHRGEFSVLRNTFSQIWSLTHIQDINAFSKWICATFNVQYYCPCGICAFSDLIVIDCDLNIRL